METYLIASSNTFFRFSVDSFVLSKAAAEGDHANFEVIEQEYLKDCLFAVGVTRGANSGDSKMQGLLYVIFLNVEDFRFS
jgi:hypothetical protein